MDRGRRERCDYLRQYGRVLNGDEYELDGETILCKRVTEEGITPTDPLVAGSEQTLTLEPLAVTAFLLTPKP